MSAAPATLGAMSTVTVALATQRALAESAALRLLRAQNAPALSNGGHYDSALVQGM